MAERDLATCPERAELALLCAAGLLQVGDREKARRQLRDATDWGCDRDLLHRVLIGGTLCSLGNAAMLFDAPAAAQGYFHRSARESSPLGDDEALGRARASRARRRLGLDTDTA